MAKSMAFKNWDGANRVKFKEEIAKAKAAGKKAASEDRVLNLCTMTSLKI